MAEIPGWIVGLLTLLIAIGGGSAAASIERTAIQTQQVAKAAAESIAQNGCYTASAEAAVGSALQKAGMDPAKVALTATTTKQGYGQAVDVRVEYVREFKVLGWETPWVWRAGAEASDVSTNVAPVQNQPCKAPTFAAATGQSGLESANSPAMLAMQSGRDFTTLAAGADSCTKPVQKTRTVTKYKDETYQVQVGTRQETRYKDETYQEPVQKTRTVTKYREETRYRTETTTQFVQGESAGVKMSASNYGGTYSAPENWYTWYHMPTPARMQNGAYALRAWIVKPNNRGNIYGDGSYTLPDTVTVNQGEWVAVNAQQCYKQWWDGRENCYANTSWSSGISVRSPVTGIVTRMEPLSTWDYGYWWSVNQLRFQVPADLAPGIYYLQVSDAGASQAGLAMKLIVNGYATVTRQVPYTVQVPYQVTETYTEMVTKTRQVPYTVDVPVMETRTRRVPYQEQETYTVYAPCSA